MKKTLKIFLMIAVLSGSFAVPVRNQTAGAGRKPVRRALLVGVSEYNKLDTNQSFTDLSSVKNDIKAMAALLALPGYEFKIKKLEDEDATRENILEAIRKFLIEEAAPGDVSLFYFSGHGSQIRNSLGGESDLIDETFVPYDVIRPVRKESDLRDIRDKEINALMKKAALKGVRIIFIADSCHSGSIGRDDEEIRQIEAARIDFCKSSGGEEFDVCEPADKKNLNEAFEKGAMVVSAARDFQQASPGDYAQDEIPGPEKNYLGNLTANLLLTLYETPADLVSADDLFTRVAAKMHGRGLSQIPEIDATPERKKKTLFGDEVNPEIPKFFIDEEGFLAGGRAAGQTEGSEFVRVRPSGGDEADAPVRIRLTDVGLGKSAFEVVAKEGVKAPEVKPGYLFRQDSWGEAAKPNLTVWMPSSNLSRAEVGEIARKIEELRRDKDIRIIDSPDEPGTDEPTHFLYLEETGGKRQWVFDHPRGAAERLDAFPTAEVLRRSAKSRNFTGRMNLRIELPVPADFAGKLGEMTANSRSPVTGAARSGAIYQLAGRARAKDGKVVAEYAWVLPSAFARSAAGQMPNGLPSRSKWFALDDDEISGKLKTAALKLAKIRGWLELEAPRPDQTKETYRIELRNDRGEKLENGSPVYTGEIYDLYLTWDGQKECFLDRDCVFFIYVLLIDGKGKSKLVYGNNPPSDKLKQGSEYALTDRIFPLRFYGAEEDGLLGAENFILLITDELIANKDLLEFEGVRTAEEQEEVGRSVPSGGLENLLTDIGGETRDVGTKTVPSDWFVDKMTFVSREKQGEIKSKKDPK